MRRMAVTGEDLAAAPGVPPGGTHGSRPMGSVLRPLATLTVLAALLALGALAVAVAWDLPTGLTVGDVVWAGAWALYAVVGGFVARRLPAHPVGWLFLAAGLLVPIASVLDAAGTVMGEDPGAR